MHQFKQMAEWLEKVGKGEIVFAENDADSAFGICSNAATLYTDEWVCFKHRGSKLYNQAVKSWEHFTGDYAYPIPDTRGILTPEDAYSMLEKWSGVYGDLRMDLCLHLAKVISDNLNELEVTYNSLKLEEVE